MNLSEGSSQGPNQDLLQQILNYFKEAKSPSYYLDKISILLHSPQVLLYAWSEDRWTLTHQFGTDAEAFARGLVNDFPEMMQRAEKQGYAFAPNQKRSEGQQKTFAVLTLCIHLHQKLAIVTFIDRQNGETFSDMVLRQRLLSQSLKLESEQVIVSKSIEKPTVDERSQPIRRVMESHDFKVAAFSLVQEMAHRFGAIRVSLGWDQGSYIRVKAISNCEHFESGSDHVQKLESVLEESFDQGKRLQYPSDKSHLLTKAHRNYAEHHAVSAMISFPLFYHGRCCAVLCFEADKVFSEEEILIIEQHLLELSPVLYWLYDKQRPIVLKVKEKLNHLAAMVLGPEKSISKLCSLFFMVLLMYVVFGTWEYRVEVPLTIDTHQRHYVSAPFEGFVHEVFVRPGDIVKKGQALLSIDTRQLLLQESEARAEIQRFDAEIEKNRSKRDFANMKIAEARKVQAEASLDQIINHLKLAVVSSPIDGVVVEGERDELLGAPINKGDLVFRVVLLDDLYLKLKVHERDIAQLKEQQSGHFSLISRPDLEIPFVIQSIIPVATVESQEGNTFEVHATFDHHQYPWLRSGMNGLGKVQAGPRNIIWILSHRLVDRLRMTLWW